MTVSILRLKKLQKRMKKLLMILFGIILTTTTISSQPISKDTVVTITPTQLKTANLIFAEHELLSKKMPLLESKISNLETVNSNWIKVDSLRSNQLTLYKQSLENKDNDIKSLKNSLTKSKTVAGVTVLTTIILALVCAFK